jgi:hypothetical protein
LRKIRRLATNIAMCFKRELPNYDAVVEKRSVPLEIPWTNRHIS